MKSRSSTGVGQKIDLDYDMETMRITDSGGDQNDSGGYIKKPSIMDTLKPKSIVNDSQEEVGKVEVDVQSAKLKQLLSDIKNKS